MKLHTIKNNFSAGELSPLLSTRTDIAQYQNGAKELTNVIPLVEGGIRKRPGTLFCDSLSVVSRRLIPFIVNAENTFLLIVGSASIEVYNPRTKTTVANLSTPYESDAQVRELQYVHTRYSMFFTQGSHPVQWLRCSQDFTNWTFDEFTFDVPPVDEIALTPNVNLTPSEKDVGKTATLSASGFAAWSDSTAYIVDEKVWYNSAVWRCTANNTNKQPDINPGYWIAVDSSEVYAFGYSNIGDLVFINGGIIRITEYVSDFSVKGEVLTALTATVEAISKSWTLKDPAFSPGRGYPKCCAIFKQRLVLANTRTYPNTVWFSRIADYHNFMPTTLDADSFSVAPSSDQSDNILHLAQNRGVVALTGGGEFLIKSDGPLTPTTAEIDEHTSYGTFANVRPTRVGSELLFVQRGGERLRAMSYRYEVDGLVSPELSAVASHIGESHQGIIETTYQQEPESLVWCVLGDGKVASITLNREQEVTAWAQHDFGGSVKSMCSIPTALGSDQCFLLVERKERYVLEELSFNALTDCQTTETLVNGEINTLMSLYLDDDGIVGYYQFGDYCYQVPYEGQGVNTFIFSSDEDVVVSFGRKIECTCVLNPPELSGAGTSSLDRKATIHHAYLYLYKTLGVQFNGALISLQDFDDYLLAPSKVFTGRYKHNCSGWTDLYDMELRITHNQPLPFHLQAISIVVSINEK